MPYDPSDFSASERRAQHPLHSAGGRDAYPKVKGGAGWLARWRNDEATHVWVRLSMYAVLCTIALLSLAHYLQTERKESIRSTDAELVAASAQQGALSQQLGTWAMQLRMPGVDAETVRERLVQALARARDGSDRLDGMLTQQAKLKPDVAQEKRLALEAWVQARERLWARTQEVLLATEPRELTTAVEALQPELDAAGEASVTLTLALQLGAQRRSDGAQSQNLLQLCFLALILVLLAWAVVEPTARQVRRQYLTLSRQAVRLQRLAMVAERSPNAIAIAGADRKLLWVNQAFVILTGYTAEQSVGQHMGALMKKGSADPEGLEALVQAVEQGVGIKVETKIYGPEADRRAVLMDVQPITLDGGHNDGWVLVASDLTEVREQEQLLSLAVDGAGLGIWHWDIKAGTIGSNARMQKIMGYPRGTLGHLTRDWNRLIHPDDFKPWIDSVKAHLNNGDLTHRMSIRMQHHSGRWVWVMFAGTVVDRTATGRALRMAGVAMDVQAQKTMEYELRAAAHTDGLTQLPNRLAVVDLIGVALKKSQAQPGYQFAVLFMDFDRFKQVNDTLGHSAGDELLRQIARRLQDSLRPGDSFIQTGDFAQTAARLGGDEFVVLLDDIRGDLDAEVVAGRLLDVLAAPYQLGSNRIVSSASIGIVTSTCAAEDADSVLRDADIAMYEAKRTGRARYVMFDPAMRQRLTASVGLENDLRQALVRKELFVVYQPLVDLATGQLAGLEALMRWRHSTRGMVPPVEFIPVAEASGLIGGMGLFVLQTACDDFASMQDALGPLAPTSVAVNLSREQLRQPGLASDVQDALRKGSMDSCHLVLEVTESLAAQDAQVLSTLHELRAMGVTLSLDDFGTGYSSLSCLHELPVNVVKIDRSFVSQADQSDYHRVLIEATIRMAGVLGLATVAEGIETPVQARLMQQLGCGKGQGYLYSKPLELPALVEWVRQHAATPAGEATPP